MADSIKTASVKTRGVVDAMTRLGRHKKRFLQQRKQAAPATPPTQTPRPATMGGA